MKRNLTAIVAVSGLLALGACGTSPGERAVTGGLLGAGTGAAIGSFSGNAGTGALIGGALGLSGAVLQGYLRNPLAEPGLMGVTGGASLGAVIAIHSGASSALALALPAGGLAGAALATLAVMLLAGPSGGSLTLVLAGIAISSVAGALTTLALNLSPNPFASVEILFWMMGSLGDRSLLHVWLAAPLILAGSAVLLTTGRVVSHYLSGTQTRRIGPLVEQYPEPKIEMHSRLAEVHGIVSGDWARITTRRAAVVAQVNVVKTIRPDTIFIPYHWGEQLAVNQLTNPALDPTSKIPEYKACAARIEKIHARELPILGKGRKGTSMSEVQRGK